MEALTNILKIFNIENQIINNNVWFWISIIEFIIILVLMFISSRKKFKKSKFKRDKVIALKEDIDFSNIINSSFNSKVLYDELIRKCHPDKFVENEEKNKMAVLISQEITKNKNDVKRLLELKELAIKQLNINI